MISRRCSISKATILLFTILIIPFISQATEHAEIFSISQPDVGLNEPEPKVSWTMALVGTEIKSFLEISFEENSAPISSATFPDDKVGIFEPQITFSFLGEQDELAGMVEISLYFVSLSG